MEQNLKQRLVGALVLISLAVIFLPLAFDGQQHRIDPAEYSIPEKPAITITAPEVEPLEQAIQQEYAPVAEVAQAKQVQDEAAEAEDSALDSQPAPTQPPAEQTAAQSTPVEQTRQYLEQEKAVDAALQDKPVTTTVPLADAWIIQVGAFSSEANARGLQDKLKAAGYPAFVKPVQGGSGQLFKVYVGPEIRRTELERQKSALERQYNLKALILKYIP